MEGGEIKTKEGKKDGWKEARKAGGSPIIGRN